MIDVRSRQASEALNTSSTPWTINIDMQIDKTFEVYRNVTTNLYLRIINLFNTKNVLNLFTRTGSTADDGWIDSPAAQGARDYYGQSYKDLYNTINIENGQAYWEYTGNQMYGHPRQILLGIRVAY